MSRLRFNHVFFALMALGCASSLVLPTAYTTFARGLADNLLSPLTETTRQVAAWVQKRTNSSGMSPAPMRAAGAPVTPAQFQERADALEAKVYQLTAENEQLRKIVSQMEMLGEAGKNSRPFKVLFSDSAQRDSLTIKAGQGSGVEKGMPVITGQDVVGKVAGAGMTGAQVRLVTDPESWTKVRFGRQDTLEGQPAFVMFRTDRYPVCQGVGNGRMQIRNLYMREIESIQLGNGLTYKLREGDQVLLDDESEWPAEFTGRRIGIIEKIEPQRKAPLFAQITVVPRIDLRQLTGVMVVMKR